MAYEIVWSPMARDQLAALDKEVRNRLISKVISAGADPHHYAERMVGYSFSKIRSGDYRALVELDDAQKKMVVLKAGHRKNIYK